MVFGKYKGKGGSAIKLRGDLANEKKEFVYEYNFPEKTSDSKSFVEQLWARRKVGFLLDQIRANGEKGELVDEVTKLAKKYGITTPYTSYLVVPDHVAYPIHRPVPGYPTPKLPVPFGLLPHRVVMKIAKFLNLRVKIKVDRANLQRAGRLLLKKLLSLLELQVRPVQSN